MKITFQNFFAMKTLCVAFVALLFCVNVNAQENCDDFGEGDFMDLCVEQMGDGTTGPVMSDIIDVDPANGTAGDVQLTIESVVCNSGCGVGGPYNIGACIGGLGSLGTSSDFAADFNNGANGTPATTCNNAGGYVCVTIDFLNGFSSTAAGFDLAQSSNNGSSEGYEGSFGYVTAGTDASGAPLTLPTITMTNFCNYTIADYAAGTSMSAFLGATGAGTYQTDDPNATAAACGGGGGQNDEDSGSGSGATNGTAAAAANANLGLNPTDIITQVKHIYFYSSTPGADCDGDGQSGAESNPSGSWSDVDFCFELPCGYPVEPTVTLEESCGTFNIIVGTIDESGASGTGTVVTYDTSDMGTFANAVTGAEGLPADGTPYYIQICDAADATCCDVFGPFSVTGSTPNVPTFIPCTTGTTGIGGN